MSYNKHLKLHKILIFIFILILSVTMIPIKVFANDTLPSVSAPACILMDLNSGKILYSKNANDKMYPASTTKVMTAILTLEKCKLTDTAVVSHNAIFSVPNGYSIASLQEGEVLTIEQLLNVLLIPSANDAAFVLAEHIAGSVDEFANMMNQKAIEIGCKNTHFVNPNGIHNENHYSTAYDLAIIGQYAMKFDVFRKIVATTSYQLPIASKYDKSNSDGNYIIEGNIASTTNEYDKADRFFNTTNELLKKNFSSSSTNYYYQYATGAKTGYTEAAKNCIIATAKKDNMELVAVVLHDEKTEDGINQRPIDCKKLFEYGFNNYSNQKIATLGDVEKTIFINNATSDTKRLDLTLDKDIYALNPNNYDSSKIVSNIIINDDIKAPITEGQILGTITFTSDNSTYQANLLASHAVLEYDFVKTGLELVLVIIILLILFLLKRRKKKNKSNGKNNSKSSKFNINKKSKKGFGKSKQHRNRSNYNYFSDGFYPKFNPQK